jgi:uncharacterized protein YndB with AHSA1/START domain
VIDATEQVHIDRPPEDVWDYFTDIANDPEWSPSTKSSQKTSDGPLSVGTTFLVDRKQSGQTEMEYVEYTRPTRWILKGSAKPASFTYTADLAVAGGGTDLTSHMQLEPKGAFKLMSPFMKGFVSKQLKQVHAALKHKLESGVG